ncbi:alpha/beta hydrolase [Tateyamaria omphalii]|uniref:Alpha/beta hydrolase n=1 Tax=Tateyamaria omphalii TaxID=299262 RepID=A0A1P8MX71_9RHOB|nr:alpha/beta fold hydrolase [Tateyamaria omphalii]APX12608.1 alpha/beta hydrolase [Tateyamaria omphalii]
MRGWLVAVVAVLVAAWAVTVLEGARAGLTIEDRRVGDTPVTIYSSAADGPPVIVAHGFAGSRQMMQGYSLVLAQAGYTVHAFDFEGHGLHPTPMGGDVNAIDGTTQRLVTQTRAVIDSVAGDVPVALLGHSMATDVLVRVAQDDPRVGPIVLLSAFSRAIDAAHPGHMLLVTGVWEPGLTDFALEAARMVDPAAVVGETVVAGDVSRRAVLAPYAEHVAILHSRAGRAEALDWVNGFYQRSGVASVPPTGWALIALLFAVTALVAPLARLFPQKAPGVQPMGWRAFALVAFVPALVAPLIAAPLDTRLLPVLVADYLALHLFIYGLLQLGLLFWTGRRLTAPAPLAAGILVVWGLGVFGLALDRYGANFWPTDGRLPILAALALGAVPFMLADARAAFGAPAWQRVVLRLALLVSLGIAVALDFEGLFFLIMIAPVILLFFLTFGVMGRAFAKRTGPGTAGLALGLVLAWALGVSFPLFSA